MSVLALFQSHNQTFRKPSTTVMKFVGGFYKQLDKLWKKRGTTFKAHTDGQKEKDYKLKEDSPHTW